MPRAEHRAHERAGHPAPAPPARQASRSPEPPAQPSAHPPSRPLSSREITRAGRTHGDARSAQRRTSTRKHAADAARPWLSVEADGPVDRPGGTDARPLYVRGCRNTPVHNGPQGREFAVRRLPLRVEASRGGRGGRFLRAASPTQVPSSASGGSSPSLASSASSTQPVSSAPGTPSSPARSATQARSPTRPWPLGEWLRGVRPRSLRKNLLADHGDHC